MSLASEEIIQYLNRTAALEIVPNFWLSEEYLSIQKEAELRTNGKVIWIQEGDWAVFPPLPLHGKTLEPEACPEGLLIWSDFENFFVGGIEGFLDWEYTYDSNHFFNMVGGKWAVFRKNSRKWPRTNADKDWEYTIQPPSRKEIKRLLIEWLENRNEIIHDDESLEWFVFNGSRRGFLLRKGELVGINVWDVYPFRPHRLMYRYCIATPGEPFLDEFCRLLFYQSVPGRLVIDGGSLGNPGLERFKDKLNPVKKRPVYSRKMA